MVSVDLKLNTVEEQQQTKVVGFSETTGKPQKPALGLNPGEENFCNLESKHNRRRAPRSKQFVSVRK
jgi:hypothetical protein